MSNYNCLTMMILRKCRANYEELTSLINIPPGRSSPGSRGQMMRQEGKHYEHETEYHD